MLPKDGDLSMPSNWRPVAILPIICKLFARLVYDRISPILFATQSCEQHAFTPGIRIEDALLSAEVAIEYALEFDTPLWLMSMDMRKIFDTIEFRALFQALRNHGLDESYLQLLKVLYSKPTGTANGSDEFPILRGVKQGDVLSAILFNCALDMAFEKWKLRLRDQGLFIADGHDRLTNTRYADDVLLYGKSLEELQDMTESLITELADVGLKLNVSKTKILHTQFKDDGWSNDFVDIAGEMVEVLHAEEAHRYLGRRLSMSASERVTTEFKFRKQQAWYAFSKHRKVLLNKHVSLKRRLQYFDACVTPTMLFALATLPLTKARLKDLDILQRKMLRRIVGWRRQENEPWEETMRRMNRRLEFGQKLHFSQPWSISYARAQWRYALHVACGSNELWSQRLVQYNCTAKVDPKSPHLPYRTRGHPCMRWDDNIRKFCWMNWQTRFGRHWSDAFSNVDAQTFEDEYVIFLAGDLV